MLRETRVHAHPAATLVWTVHVAGGVLTIVPEGELDVATAPLLDDALREMRRDRAGELVVDLRRLTFIDSAGIHLLLRWATEAGRAGHGLRLIPGAERVQFVLAMTGVLRALRFADPPPPTPLGGRR